MTCQYCGGPATKLHVSNGVVIGTVCDLHRNRHKDEGIRAVILATVPVGREVILPDGTRQKVERHGVSGTLLQPQARATKSMNVGGKTIEFKARKRPQIVSSGTEVIMIRE